MWQGLWDEQIFQQFFLFCSMFFFFGQTKNETVTKDKSCVYLFEQQIKFSNAFKTIGM